MSYYAGILCVEDAKCLLYAIEHRGLRVQYRIAIGTGVSAEEYCRIMDFLSPELRDNIVKVENPREPPFLPRDLDITVYSVSDVLNVEANPEQTVLVRIPISLPDQVVEDISVCATKRGFFCAGGLLSVYPHQVQHWWRQDRESLISGHCPLPDWLKLISSNMAIFGVLCLGWRFWSNSKSKTS